MSFECSGLLDTNLIVRHFLGDHHDHSPRATAMIASIARGDRFVMLSDCVVFEVVFVLHKIYGIEREQITNERGALLKIPGMVLTNKRLFIDTFGLWVKDTGLSFVDCYQLCLAKQLGLPGVITFDRKMDRVPGAGRIEP